MLQVLIIRAEGAAVETAVKHLATLLQQTQPPTLLESPGVVEEIRPALPPKGKPGPKVKKRKPGRRVSPEAFGRTFEAAGQTATRRSPRDADKPVTSSATQLDTTADGGLAPDPARSARYRSAILDMMKAGPVVTSQLLRGVKRDAGMTDEQHAAGVRNALTVLKTKGQIERAGQNWVRASQ